MADNLQHPRPTGTSHLRYDKLDGVPESEGNPVTDPQTEDPSGLSRLSLVTKDFPIGNGFGPELTKHATHPALSKPMASVYDQAAYQSTGRLVPKAPYRTPYYAPPWTGNAPVLPIVNRSVFDLGRALRRGIDKTSLPRWITGSRLSQAGVGALAGAGVGTGLSFLNSLQGAPADSPGSPGAVGAAIGALLGALRRPS